MHAKAVHRGDMLGGRGLLIALNRSRKLYQCVPRCIAMHLERPSCQVGISAMVEHIHI